MKEIDNILDKMKAYGCRKEIMDAFEKLSGSNKQACAIASLRKYRKELQGEIDKEGRPIDYLDYMIYELEKHRQQ